MASRLAHAIFTFVLHMAVALAAPVLIHTLLRSADETSVQVLGLELLAVAGTAVTALFYVTGCMRWQEAGARYELWRMQVADTAACGWGVYFVAALLASTIDRMALPLAVASAVAAVGWLRVSVGAEMNLQADYGPFQF